MGIQWRITKKFVSKFCLKLADLVACLLWVELATLQTGTRRTGPKSKDTARPDAVHLGTSCLLTSMGCDEERPLRWEETGCFTPAQTDPSATVFRDSQSGLKNHKNSWQSRLWKASMKTRTVYLLNSILMFWSSLKPLYSFIVITWRRTLELEWD